MRSVTSREGRVSRNEHGMIDMSYVQEQMEMNRRKELLEKHPYKIWEGKDRKWYTYISDGNGNRKLKTRKNRESLEEFLICHYKEKAENPLVKEVFREWIDGKVQRGDIELATKDRYENQFKKCFSTIENKKIKSISEYDIEEFVLNCICENDLTVKSYSNMRTLLYGTFRMAK